MYYNRELSWLGFNHRVLQEAASPSVPLFERLKFLSIFSSNLDEFFRVRYPAVLAFRALKKKTRKELTGEWTEDVVEKIQAEITRQLEEYGSILLRNILPALKENNIYLYYNEQVREGHKEQVKDIFLSDVLSFIQPLLLDGRNCFNPENNQLYFAVVLKKPEEELIRHAVVNIPSEKLNRFFILSPVENMNYVVFLDDIIRENIGLIFPGFEILSVYSFKINRDAELRLEEEYETDILNKIEKQLNKRDFGPPSRFLYETGMPLNIQLFFASLLEFKLDDLFAGGRYHNLKDFATLPSFGKQLAYERLEPVANKNILKSGDIFKLISQKDLLVHLPYQSYNPILSFFNQAMIDPEVKEIFITLYRVAAESHIANAMIGAAKNGKKVTVFLELKARFDEANNIRWSRKMKEAGVKLIYGIPGIKVHSKIALIRKQTKEGRVDFSILCTGNFNEVTARFYTDHVLMTTDETIGNELLQLFDFLQQGRLPGNKHELKFQKLLVSQFNMIDRFEELIQLEIKKAKKETGGFIRIKLNNLEEPEMINRLYKASKAGVKIQLIIRSICCLVPLQPNRSENIIVKRIVDRYLEHSRIFIFGAGDDCEVVFGSADWMNRNLHRRIEVCVPIENAECKKELVDYFDLQWKDNDKAVVLDSNMNQQKGTVNGAVVINAQQAIYNYIKQNA
jgi:polyphosphate kinase